MIDVGAHPLAPQSTVASAVHLGYKWTELGVLPDDWDCVRLGDVTSHVGSGITPTGGSRVYTTQGRPFLRSQNVGWGRLELGDVAFVSDDIHATFPATEIEAGDVLLNITGASIGRSAVADERVAGGNVNQHVCEIRPDRRKLDPRYLNSYLLSASGQNQISTLQSGGNRQGINYSQIRSFLVPRPPVTEQRAIAEALWDVDGFLAALEALIAKKRAIKRAAMQQLLTGKTRLPGFGGDWKKTCLGGIGRFSKGRGIRRDEVTDDGVPCIRYGEIYTRYNDYVILPVSHLPAIVAKGALPIKKGDLLFAGSGETAEEIGKCVAYLGDEPAFAGGDLIVLSPLGQDSMYLGHLMNHPSVARQRERFGQGDAVVHISAKNLAQVEVDLPPLEEQAAIATMLRDMDADIAALERWRDKKRAIKQGMMQELLTGRVRLIKPVQVPAGA